MIEVEEINDRRQLPEIERRWEQLRKRCGCTAPYLHYVWYAASLETADRDKNPLVLFIKSSGQDIGMVPLVYRRLQRCGLNICRLQFANNPRTPYQLILHTDDLRAMLIGVFEYLKKIFGALYVLDLNELRLSEDEKNAFRHPDVSGRVLVEWHEKVSSRYVPFLGDFVQTLAALEKKTQKEFRRKIRRLDEQGVLNLVKITGEDQISAHLEHFFALYGKTWKEPELYPEFYLTICRKFALSGALLFYALTLDGQPIAYLICIRESAVVSGIKITYDTGFSAFSPGVALVYKSIEDMFTIPGIREFDIGRGDEQFKREWTSLFHEHQRLIIRPKTALWRIAHVVQHYVLPVIKRHESLNKLFDRARRWITRG